VEGVAGRMRRRTGRRCPGPTGRPGAGHRHRHRRRAGGGWRSGLVRAASLSRCQSAAAAGRRPPPGRFVITTAWNCSGHGVGSGGGAGLHPTTVAANAATAARRRSGRAGEDSTSAERGPTAAVGRFRGGSRVVKAFRRVDGGMAVSGAARVSVRLLGDGFQAAGCWTCAPA